jgi:hypothetical protein
MHTAISRKMRLLLFRSEYQFSGDEAAAEPQNQSNAIGKA